MPGIEDLLNNNKRFDSPNITNNKVTTNTTGGKIYIVELGKKAERLEFQFVPQGIQIDSVADHAEIQVVGRNNPINHYVGGNDTLKIPLEFYAVEEKGDDVIKKVRWLQALRYNDGTIKKRNVMLVFGDIFTNENLVWIVTQVGVKLQDFHSERGFLPVRAYVDLTLKLDPKVNITKKDIRV